jgi:(1->4)-alpha-D-glucan 1-alpha-D-glucosylmutase
MLPALVRSPADGRLKLWLAWRLLALRQDDPELFQCGRYVALRVIGARRRHVLAFARRSARATLLVIVGRKFVGLGAEAGTMPIGEALWDGTQVQRPAWLGPSELCGFEVLADREVTVPPGPLALGRQFLHVPVSAVLFRTTGAANRAPGAAPISRSD